MYITPDVFETASLVDTEMPHATGAVHVTYDIQSSTLGKRRRAGCDDARDLSPYAVDAINRCSGNG